MPSAKPRRSRIRARFPRDDVHHGGLAGAVGADDAEHLPRIDVQRELVERLKAVEADGQVLEIEPLVANAHLLSVICLCPAPAPGR